MTVAAHGGDIYQNQITYDFSVNTNPLPLPEILQKRMAEAAVHSHHQHHTQESHKQTA